ncbi:OsmC family peroxiredoxin [Flavobacteriaceae bacterium Ap0902]|nr:OsmC family peroxiredoxin [Flavobacteriaceae bacterium Ap0902]
MAQEHTYQVRVKWENDRKGTLSSEVLNDNITIATPPEFKKGMAGIWSPEHYLLSAVNGCLMTTFLAIAENFKLEFKSFDSDSEGKLGMVDGVYMMSEITLKPTVVITKEEDRELAEKVLQKSEKACLISNSVKSKVDMITNIIVE